VNLTQTEAILLLLTVSLILTKFDLILTILVAHVSTPLMIEAMLLCSAAESALNIAV
jgi:hypothetical protein